MDVTEILANGIAHKRAGNYAAALAAYDQARSVDPTHEHVYLNPAKLLTGIKKYDMALRYWMVLCDYNLTRAPVDVAKNVAGELIDRSTMMLAESLYMQGEIVMPGGNIIKAKTIEYLLDDDARLQDIVKRSDNLTFYVGHCAARQIPGLTEANRVSENEMNNLEASVLGHPVGADHRQTKHLPFFLQTGFLFIVLNSTCRSQTFKDGGLHYLASDLTLNYQIDSFPQPDLLSW